MVSYLLSQGAKSTIAEFSRRMTPLMAAVERNALGTVECLLTAADAQLALRVLDSHGRRVDEVTAHPAIRILILQFLSKFQVSN